MNLWRRSAAEPKRGTEAFQGPFQCLRLRRIELSLDFIFRQFPIHRLAFGPPHQRLSIAKMDCLVKPPWAELIEIYCFENLDRELSRCDVFFIRNRRELALQNIFDEPWPHWVENRIDKLLCKVLVFRVSGGQSSRLFSSRHLRMSYATRAGKYSASVDSPSPSKSCGIRWYCRVESSVPPRTPAL